MMAILSLLDQIAIGIYILLVAVGVWQFRRFLVAHQEYRATYFELERQLARYQQIGAVTTLVVVVQVGLMVLGVQRVVVPYLESEVALQEQVTLGRGTVTDGEFNTPTPAPILSSGGLDIEPVAPLGGDGQVVLLLTPTLTPTPVGTIVPNAPAGEGCADERAQLLIPANGMRVFQPIVVVGTAFADDFARAKLEIEGPTTQFSYAVLNDILQPVPQVREFSQFVPTNYIDGVYKFRLTVFDVNNTLVASCMVNIFISAPPVLATPTPQPASS